MYVIQLCAYLFFFFKQKTAYEMRISDWSSDVCSSDLKEGHRLAAVDQAMIVGKRKIHHRADHDLSVAHDRPVLDAVHAKHGRLRRIDDRRRQQRAEHSTV